MEWFRHYHGLCTDPKLHRVALEARVRRSVAIAGWCAVLESASDGEPRGTCSLDGTDLGLRIGESAAIGDRLLAAFRDRKMLDAAGFVCSWMKRQRAVDDVAKRVAKHRSAKSLNGQDPDPGGNVTSPLRNVTETACNDQNRADSDSESEKKESPPPVVLVPHALPPRDDDDERPKDRLSPLIDEMRRKAGPSPGDRIGREVAAWADVLGVERTAVLLEQTLRGATRNPMAYAACLASEQIERLETARAVAATPLPDTPDPWFEAIRKNRDRDRCDSTTDDHDDHQPPAHRTLLQ